MKSLKDFKYKFQRSRRLVMLCLSHDAEQAVAAYRLDGMNEGRAVAIWLRALLAALWCVSCSRSRAWRAFRRAGQQLVAP